MAKTRRRASGGGRKPQGEFDQLTSPFSLRMPEDLRKQLEAAADRAGAAPARNFCAAYMILLAGIATRFVIRPHAPFVFCLPNLWSAYAGHCPMNGTATPFYLERSKLVSLEILDELEPQGEENSPFRPTTSKEVGTQTPEV